PHSSTLFPYTTLFRSLPGELRSLIAAELNVASLSVLSGELVDYVVKPNFRILGRRFGRQTPSVAAAIAAMPAADIAAAVLAGGTDRKSTRLNSSHVSI